MRVLSKNVIYLEKKPAFKDVKDLLCNWFVCLSLWLAASFDTLTDKGVGLFVLIAGFFALGLEHRVAYMYIIPQGMVLDVDITVG